MYGIKSREGSWSASLCNCSQDTIHVHHSNVVLHVLRELRLAMQNVAGGIVQPEPEDVSEVKKGLVQ